MQGHPYIHSSLCNESFNSGCFKGFLFITSSEHFDYDMPRCSFFLFLVLGFVELFGSMGYEILLPG